MGSKFAARGIYRDPVRSSRSHLVKTSGLHWISLMLLAPIPWAGRVWALPFLTALVPSERYRVVEGRRHKDQILFVNSSAVKDKLDATYGPNGPTRPRTRTSSRPTS